MAGKSVVARVTLITILWAFVLNGVLGHSHHPRLPHLCEAFDESSEECDKYHLKTDSSGMYTPPVISGLLGATEFEEKYILYTHGTPAQSFTFKDLEKKNITYEHHAPWKILIHGFLNNGGTSFPVNVQQAYMRRMKENPGEKYNVLVLDWGAGACASVVTHLPAPYHNAAENVEAAGKKLGRLLVKFQQEGVIDLSEIHIIGHSLGAHVAGQTARFVYEKTGKYLWRISALDPAGPLFWRESFLLKRNPYPRLRRNRVLFLDIYHTSRMYGSPEEMGDVDFYVNGGLSQPSCQLVPKTPIFGIPIPLPIPDVFLQVCSHNYATDMYARSINDKKITGCTGCLNYEEYRTNKCNCEDHAVLGEFVTEETIEGYPSASGAVYVTTPKDTSVSSNYLQMLKEKGIFNLAWSGLKALCI